MVLLRYLGMKQRSKNLWKEILFVSPVLLIYVSQIFKNEYIIFASAVIAIFLIFILKYEKNEWILLCLGIILGIIVELGGDLIYKIQYWQNGSFYGIPLWIPLFWGIAFIVFRRIGNAIINYTSNK